MSGGNDTRLRLKEPRGWFAAGTQFHRAMSRLSDGAFKLFVWLCLEADRRSGSTRATQRELARAIGKSRRAVGTYIRELDAKAICKVEAGTNQHDPTCFQISEEYWPYHRVEQQEVESSSDYQTRETPEPNNGSNGYVEQVRRSFIGLGCAKECFDEADARLAKELYQRGVPLDSVEDALLLGAVRKYLSWLNNGESAPIGSLKYFEGLLREVSEQPWPREYRDYLRQKKAKLGQIWAKEAASKRLINSSEPLGCNRRQLLKC